MVFLENTLKNTMKRKFLLSTEDMVNKSILLLHLVN